MTSQSMDVVRANLVDALQVAVPLRILELAAMTDRQRAGMMAADAANAADAVGHRGDVLLFSGTNAKARRECAETFNALARGIAVLAHQPGGVHVFGVLWCARHAPWGAAPPANGVCPGCLADERVPAGGSAATGPVPPSARLVVTVDTGGLL